MTESKPAIETFPCECHDPECRVDILVFEDLVYAEFPVCMSVTSGNKTLNRLLRARPFWDGESIFDAEPGEIPRVLAEWLTFPLSFLLRLIFLLFSPPYMVADCFPSGETMAALERRAEELGTKELRGFFSKSEGEDNPGIRQYLGKIKRQGDIVSLRVSPGTKLNIAVYGLAAGRMKCCFNKDGVREFLL